MKRALVAVVLVAARGCGGLVVAEPRDRSRSLAGLCRRRIRPRVAHADRPHHRHRRRARRPGGGGRPLFTQDDADDIGARDAAAGKLAEAQARLANLEPAAVTPRSPRRAPTWPTWSPPGIAWPRTSRATRICCAPARPAARPWISSAPNFESGSARVEAAIARLAQILLRMRSSISKKARSKSPLSQSRARKPSSRYWGRMNSAERDA